MKLLIDNANIETIRRLYEYYPVDGVTTNPSILAKEGRNPFEVLKEIRAVIGADAQLHAQAVLPTAEGMIDEAHRIVDVLGDKTYVKIPAIEEGFKAMKLLHKEGIRVTATVVYNEMQACMSAMCGADYAAPYVNRVTVLGGDGIKLACNIHDMFVKNNFHCQVLGASFKQTNQILELCKHSVAAVTVAPDLLISLCKVSNVDLAVNDFASDFAKLAGFGKSMKDCK